ncbi:hypothetical protein RIF29_16395 [Crotalaria pallida]|uniref:1,4-alpha-D-glucan glucanohydrolase n=1 Tax=Crotalaria pallida TaxID=3830 RepID=A0AAN9FGI3_CROPI
MGKWSSLPNSTLINRRSVLKKDSHRQRIINWIDGTRQLSTAFDFTTKGILQEAVKGNFWRLRDPQGKPPGVMGWWPSRSVTFIDNHDTGSTQEEEYGDEDIGGWKQSDY